MSNSKLTMCATGRLAVVDTAGLQAVPQHGFAAAVFTQEHPARHGAYPNHTNPLDAVMAQIHIDRHDQLRFVQCLHRNICFGVADDGHEPLFQDFHTRAQQVAWPTPCTGSAGMHTHFQQQGQSLTVAPPA